MKFSRRRWLTLIATDIVLRALTFFPAFFLAPVFSCLHLVLLGLAARFVSRFVSRLDLNALPAFAITVTIANIPFFGVVYWITDLLSGPSGPNGYTLGFVYFDVAFNVLLVLAFWLDRRFGGDAVPSTMRDLK